MLKVQNTKLSDTGEGGGRQAGEAWNQQTFPTDETASSLHQSHTKTTSTEIFYYLTSWDSKNFTEVEQFHFRITAPASLQIQYFCIIQSMFTKVVPPTQQKTENLIDCKLEIGWWQSWASTTENNTSAVP